MIVILVLHLLHFALSNSLKCDYWMIIDVPRVLNENAPALWQQLAVAVFAVLQSRFQLLLI